MQIAQFAPKWPQRLVGLLSRVKRIGADQLCAILLSIRHASREEFRNALGVDFFSYNKNGTMAMRREDFVRFVGDSFPGMFSRGFVEALFAEGAKTPARVDRSLDVEAGAAPSSSRETGEDADDQEEDGGDAPGASKAAAESAPPPQRGRSKRVPVLPLGPEAWNVQQFVSHMMAVSENVLL